MGKGTQPRRGQVGRVPELWLGALVLLERGEPMGARNWFCPAAGGAPLKGQGNGGGPAALGLGAAAGLVALGSSGCWGRSAAGGGGSPTRMLHVILCRVRQAVQTSTRKMLCSKH